MADKATRSLIRRLTVGTLVSLLIATMLVTGFLVVARKLGYEYFSIEGVSMKPTFSNGEGVVIRKNSNLKDGDIVFFKRPTAWGYALNNAPPSTFVKRVAARGGDLLTIKDRKIFVNNHLLYTFKSQYQCRRSGFYQHRLTSQEFFALGDNASESLDSRRVFCDGKDSFLISTANVVASGSVVFTL